LRVGINLNHLSFNGICDQMFGFLRLTTTERQIIHDTLEPRHGILGKRIIDTAFAGDIISVSDVAEFNNLAMILSKLRRAPWCHYNIFVKDGENLYHSESAAMHHL
jgi:hypothetical protein